MTSAERQYPDLVLLRRLFAQARPYWVHIAGLAGLGMLAAPLALLGPVPLKIVVDSVLSDHPLPDAIALFVPAGLESSRGAILGLAIAMLLLIPLLTQTVELLRTLVRSYTGERLVLELRARLFRHVQKLSMAHHDSRGTSDAIFRIQWDSPSIQNVLLNVLLHVFSAGVTLVVMLYVMIRIDPQLAAVALIISPVLAAGAYLLKTRVRPRYREVKTLDGAAHKTLQESLGALRVVKAFGQEEREEERFVDHSAKGVRARLRIALTEGIYRVGVALTVGAGTAAVLYVGVRHVQAGMLTLGNLILVMSYLSQLYAPVQTITKTAGNLQPSLAGAERVFALLDQDPDVIERPNARPVQRATGAIALRDVWFGYGTDRPVLRGVTFDIPAGALVGIRGATGAGKTTLASLLARFYDPNEGVVLLDGVDLRDYRLADLRRQFSIVLQEPVLFSNSIGENIAYARPGASEERIMAAAEAAGAHDFIVRLPDGYATAVGERGMQLSGGERQRISLARAFLKDAPILILDEPTSSVDLVTERGIMEAMERLMTGRTSFMIAHRLSTLEGCDLVLHVEDGVVSLENGPARPVLA